MKVKLITSDDIYVWGSWFHDKKNRLLMKVDWMRYRKLFNAWGKYE